MKGPKIIVDRKSMMVPKIMAVPLAVVLLGILVLLLMDIGIPAKIAFGVGALLVGDTLIKVLRQ